MNNAGSEAGHNCLIGKRYKHVWAAYVSQILFNSVGDSHVDNSAIEFRRCGDFLAPAQLYPPVTLIASFDGVMSTEVEKVLERSAEMVTGKPGPISRHAKPAERKRTAIELLLHTKVVIMHSPFSAYEEGNQLQGHH